MKRRPVVAMALIAIVVALIDIVIKLSALSLIGEREVVLVSWLHLAVHLNDQMAWGLSPGTHPALLTIVATLAIVAMGGFVGRELAQLDRWAPVAFGLIVGAGIANGLDALIPPRGAVDFLVISHAARETAINGADVALLAGILLCCRSVALLGLALHRERRPRRRTVLVPDVAVAIPMHVEGRRSRAERRTPARPHREIPLGDDLTPRA